MTQPLSSVPQTLPPAFQKWNPVKRAKYLCCNCFSPETKEPPLSTPQLTPRYPPGLSPIPSRLPLSSAHSLVPIVMGIPTECTLKITVHLHLDQGNHETTAIINSGATSSFIDTQLAYQLNLLPIPFSKPVKAYNVDGTTNCKGNIIQETKVDLSFVDYADSLYLETIQLMVLNLGKSQLILGMPWLQRWNPEINWVCQTIYLPEPKSLLPQDDVPLHECLPEVMENPNLQDHLLQCLGLDADHEIENLIQERQQWLNRETIAKTTISTKIAQQEKPVEHLSQHGVLILKMSSPRKPTRPYLPIDPMTTSLT